MAVLQRIAGVAAAGLIAVSSSAYQPAFAQSPPPANPADQAPASLTTSAPTTEAPRLLSPIAERLSSLAQRGDHADDVSALRAFYAETSGRLIWIENGVFTPRAQSILSEIQRADDWGLALSSFILPAAPQTAGLAPHLAADMDAAIAAEARLSLAILKYARHARGGRFDPSQITESLDRTPTVRPPGDVIRAIVSAEEPDGYLRKLHPQHPQFEKLRQLYLSARAGTLAEPASAPVAEGPPETVRKGRKKKRKAVAAKPVAPPAITAERVLVNMEQWRWMPEDLGKLHVLVNIPQFELQVVKNGATIYTERVVTGTAKNQTPIFSKDMQTVVFQPGWGVPSGIKVKELLPGLLSGRDSISGRGLVVRHRGREVSPMSINWRTTDIRKISIVQPPGPRNALGQVKFLFPNKHDVYMHDTPSKALFNASTRAFSHGCVRVRNPLKFAEVIFAETGGWAPTRVASMLRAKPENEVAVPGRVGVHLVYFTVHVDDEGKAHSLRDIYGHEPRIKAGIEGRAEMVAKKSDDLGAIRRSMVTRTRAITTAREQRPQRERRGSGGGGGGGLFGWF